MNTTLASLRGVQLSPMQKEIVRACQIQGGLTGAQADKNGWTVRGMPTGPMQELVRVHRILAPRVLTSQPLRIVWQMRELKTDKETLAKIEKEANRLGYKEYALGGFRL